MARVLHPITRLIIGGAQENTMLTAELLDRDSWEVEVICGPQTGSEGSLIESVRKRGVVLTIEPNLVREINPFKDIIALFKLSRFIRDKGFDIVHTHSSKAGILGRWAAKIAGVPIIVHTVHGWGHHSYQPRIVRHIYVWLERITLPITDRLIVVSKLNIEKGLRARIGQESDYVVIRSGIELDRFGHPDVPKAEMRRALNLEDSDLVVGSVTRLSPQKAPMDFVEAAFIVAQVVPNAKFVMVGDGPLRADVEARVGELGLTEKIILTGLRRDVPELLAAFDIFVLSSLWEGLPRVIPQAMATGLPVVATASDGTAEVLEHGVNGFLVSPLEPAAMAERIIQLANDPALRKVMGQEGKKRVAEYSDRQMVADIDKLYRELLAEKGIEAVAVGPSLG